MKTYLSRAIALAVVATASLPVLAQANLVKNGNFDLVSNAKGVAQDGDDNYVVSSTGNPWGFTLPGWTNRGDVAVVYGSGIADAAAHNPLLDPVIGRVGDCGSAGEWRRCSWILRGSQDGTPWDVKYPVTASSPAGGNFFGSDGIYPSASLSQTVTGLQVGQEYTLSFWSAGATLLTGGGTGKNSSSWAVSLTGKTTDVKTTVSNGSYSAVGGNSSWVQTLINFTASASSEVLSFTALGNGSPPMSLLDGVSVMAGHNVVPAVPEPEQWAMLGAGLLVLGLRLRGRRGEK